MVKLGSWTGKFVVLLLQIRFTVNAVLPLIFDSRLSCCLLHLSPPNNDRDLCKKKHEQHFPGNVHQS